MLPALVTARKRSLGLHLSVILFTGGWYTSMYCRWYPSMPCSRGGVCYPSMPCSRGGACSWRGLLPGVPGGDPPGQLLLRAVRILLECILVCLYVCFLAIIKGIYYCRPWEQHTTASLFYYLFLNCYSIFL